MLVMEYADSGTLKNYLKKSFETLTWNDKYRLEHQLSFDISCLHNEEIVHCDLVKFFFDLIYSILINII